MPSKKDVLLSMLEHDDSQYLSSFIPCLGSYEVHYAADAVELLAKANALEPLLLICDLDFAQQEEKRNLKKVLDENPRLRALILSARADGDAVFKPAEHRWLVKKPCDLSVLSQHVKKILPQGGPVAKDQEYARLLIADDEKDIADLLNDVFTELGIEVHTALDGKEALEVFKKDLCNLAIVDLRMPHMTGTQLIEAFESTNAPLKPKFIIILTAALGRTINDLKQLGYPVMAKPMDIAAVEKEIVEACKKYHLAFKTS